MKPISFDGANKMIDGEIPANQSFGIILTKWQGCWRERIKFLFYGTMWVSISGATLPPMLITSDRAFEITNPPVPEFWEKKDTTSMARSLRLAVVSQQYDAGNLTIDEAEELLSGPLDPDDETTIVDDSRWLGWKPQVP